jgi:hypothetical protein
MDLSSAVLERDSTFAPGGGGGNENTTEGRNSSSTIIRIQAEGFFCWGREGGGGRKEFKEAFPSPQNMET